MKKTKKFVYVVYELHYILNDCIFTYSAWELWQNNALPFRFVHLTHQDLWVRIILSQFIRKSIYAVINESFLLIYTS